MFQPIFRTGQQFNTQFIRTHTLHIKQMHTHNYSALRVEFIRQFKCTARARLAKPNAISISRIRAFCLARCPRVNAAPLHTLVLLRNSTETETQHTYTYMYDMMICLYFIRIDTKQSGAATADSMRRGRYSLWILWRYCA